MMRVANQTIFNSVAGNLGRVAETLWKANQVVSTTKKINQISDDPIGLVSVLDLRSSLSGIGQLQRNIQVGRSWLEAGESALTDAENLLSETKALCVQMANGALGPSDRSNAATVVDACLRQILSLANTEVGGRYIFGGAITDAAPFSLDDEENPSSAIYTGNGAPFQIKIGEAQTVEVGRDGEKTFGPAGGSIFDTLIHLKDALQGNDVGGIRETIGELDRHMNDVRSLISNTGAKVLRLDAKERILENLNLSYEERKSGIEDADLAEAIMELKAKELAYQAALASSSKIMAMSLMDYV